MHYPRRRLAAGDSLLQRRYRHPRCQRTIQRPADRFAREAIDDYCQVNKLGAQMDIGDVRDPELVDTSQGQARRQVHVHLAIVLRIRRQDKLAEPHRQQIVGSHHAQHALVVDHHAAAVQFGRHPPIAVPAMVRQHDFLNGRPQRHIRLVRLALL
jgi:hypothetical protein